MLCNVVDFKKLPVKIFKKQPLIASMRFIPKTKHYTNKKSEKQKTVSEKNYNKLTDIFIL